MKTEPRTPLLPAEDSRHGISSEQHQKLLHYFATATESPFPWWEAACRIAWSTGLRLSDVVSLSWSEINFSDRTITVIPHKISRRYKTVIIPMESELYDFLAHLREHPFREWHRHSKFLMPELRALYQSPARTETVRQFKLICKRAGITDKVTFKNYRQSYITRLMDAGISPMEIGKLTGLLPGPIMNWWLNSPPKT